MAAEIITIAGRSNWHGHLPRRHDHDLAQRSGHDGVQWDISTATCTPPTYLVTGIHLITADFANTDANFSEFDLAQCSIRVVQSTHKSAAILTSWPNPSVVGFPVSAHSELFSGTPAGPIRSNTDRHQ